METNELIAGPAIVGALKIRIETLTKANNELRQRIKALEVILNSEDEVKLWSKDTRISEGFKENIELRERIKELEEQIKPQENFDEFLKCTKDHKTHMTAAQMKKAVVFALNNGDVELIMDKYLLTNGEEKILKELTDRQYG